MNPSAVAAVLPPQVEAPAVRIQKAPPDGFMQALSEQCKTHELQAADPLASAAGPHARETMPSPEDSPTPPENAGAVLDDSNPTECAMPLCTGDWAALFALLAQWPPEPAAIDGETGAVESLSQPSCLSAFSGRIIAPDAPLAESVSAVSGSFAQGGSAASDAGKPVDLSRFVQALLKASADPTEPGSPVPALALDTLAAASSTARTVAGASAKITVELPDTEAFPVSAQTESDTDSVDAVGLRVSLSPPAVSKALPATELQFEPVALQRVSPAMLQEVALRGVRYLVAKNEKTIAVHLVPPSLGELRIEVCMAADALHIKFFSANPAVRDALENHLQALRDAFAANNLDVKNISVASGMAGHASSHSFAGSQFAGLADTGVSWTPAVAARSGATIELRPSAVRRLSHDGALNILI